MTTDFNDMFKERRQQAEQLGWTNVRVVYDDEYGGCYAGGVDPEDGKWKKIPNDSTDSTETTETTE
jgi:hypothetical protein